MNRWLLKVEKYSPMSLHLKWFMVFFGHFSLNGKGPVPHKISYGTCGKCRLISFEGIFRFSNLW